MPTRAWRVPKPKWFPCHSWCGSMDFFSCRSTSACCVSVISLTPLEENFPTQFCSILWISGVSTPNWIRGSNVYLGWIKPTLLRKNQALEWCQERSCLKWTLLTKEWSSKSINIINKLDSIVVCFLNMICICIDCINIILSLDNPS